MMSQKSPIRCSSFLTAFFIFSLLILSPTSKIFAHSNAKCSRVLFDLSFTLDRYDDFEELSKNRSTLVKIAPSVYALPGSQISEVETLSLQRFIQRFGGRALAIGNFADRKGTPVVDAIHYPKDPSESPVNISIKTSNNRERTNGIEFIKREISETRRSVVEHYNKTYFRDWFGVEFENGMLVAAKGKSYKQKRLNDYQVFADLIGLEQTRPRKVMVILDLADEATQSAVIHAASSMPSLASEFKIPSSDQILRVYDTRVDSHSIERPSLLNLSTLQERLRIEEAFGLGGYFVLLPRQTLTLTPRSVILE